MIVCKRNHTQDKTSRYTDHSCKQCRKLAQQSSRYIDNRKLYYKSIKAKEMSLQQQKTLSYRFRVGLRNAKVRGYDYLISFSDYAKIISNPCVYCKQTILTGHGLDRLDNNLGYTLQNVVSCCGSCNQHRNRDWTYEETKIAVNAVMNFRKENLTYVNS